MFSAGNLVLVGQPPGFCATITGSWILSVEPGSSVWASSELHSVPCQPVELTGSLLKEVLLTKAFRMTSHIGGYFTMCMENGMKREVYFGAKNV